MACRGRGASICTAYAVREQAAAAATDCHVGCRDCQVGCHGSQRVPWGAPRLPWRRPRLPSRKVWHAACLCFSMSSRTPKSRHLLPRAVLLVPLLLSSLATAATATAAAAAAAAADNEDNSALEALARAEALKVLPAPNDRQRLQVGPLPPQVRLAHCEVPVKSAQAPGLQVPGRALIELRCDGHSPWHVYIPAKIVGTTPVVLAAHAIIAGTVLTAKDLTVEQHDLTALPQGYLDDPGIAVGMTAGRAIAGSAIITNQELIGMQAVQHGQTVTLVADAGGISVRMEGRALTDGLVNQRVKVLNLSSGKVVEGIARSAQVVEIIF